MITGRVMNGAYAAGLSACCAHSVLSIRAWIADAPGTVSTRSGTLRSGRFSTNDVNDAFGTALYSDGLRVIREIPTSGRKLPNRAISMIDPPGTFGTPARMSGSSPRSCTP